MRARHFLVGTVVGVLLSSAVVVLAGSLDPPSGPTEAGSQMYTLEQIYQRLNDGTADTEMTSFTEPASGPGTGTMHTLDDIMAVAPSADNANGALPGEVLAGKTFWSLRTNSAWGTQTGTMADNGAVAYTPDTTDQPVAAGYHNGSGYVAGDADLVPGNIIDDVSIFGVTGTYPLAPVPSTGVTKCYTITHPSETPCPAIGYPGQDGEYQKGVAWPDPRFTANVDNNGDGDCQDPGEACDGTVTDNLTGLIWLKNASCASFFSGDGGPNERSWSDALTAVNSLTGGYCGLSDGSSADDWRLPNVRELFSLVDHSQWNPALPSGYSTFFTGVQSNYYWASTTPANVTAVAWRVYLNNGIVDATAKTNTLYVWPVRGGQ